MTIHQFHQKAQLPMTFSWQDRLEDVSSEGGVVEIVRDFLAIFTPEEMALLPGDCRPGKFFDANDVTSYAFSLMRQDTGSDPETAALIHKLAAFFSNASIRLSQIMARSNTYENDSRRSA
jgi:hypothetical protein